MCASITSNLVCYKHTPISLGLKVNRASSPRLTGLEQSMIYKTRTSMHRRSKLETFDFEVSFFVITFLPSATFLSLLQKHPRPRETMMYPLLNSSWFKELPHRTRNYTPFLVPGLCNMLTGKLRRPRLKHVRTAAAADSAQRTWGQRLPHFSSLVYLQSTLFVNRASFACS